MQKTNTGVFGRTECPQYTPLRMYDTRRRQLLASVLLLIGGIAQGLGGRDAPAGGAFDFPIALYQGAAELGQQELRFHEVLARGRPVVLNFWAAQCPPCLAEMPDFERFSREYAGALSVVGIDLGSFTGLGTPDQGRQLLQRLRITYPAGTTGERRVLEEYGVLGLPATFFILADGTVHRRWTSILTPDKLRELADETLVAAGGRAR